MMGNKLNNPHLGWPDVFWTLSQRWEYSRADLIDDQHGKPKHIAARGVKQKEQID